MINNEIRLIGIVTSDFVDATRSEFYPKKEFTMEVDRKKGKPDTYTITVPEKNNLIDTSESLEGKTIIMVGYTACFKGFVSITAQEIYIVGVGKPRIKNVELVPEDVVEPEPVEPKTKSGNLEDIDIPDDNLPF